VAQPAIAPVQVIGAPGGVVVGPGGFAAPFNPYQPNQITVGDGKPKALPSDVATAIRVKAMEKADIFGAVGAKELAVRLTLPAEPRIQIQNVLAVRVERAIDDNDQKLAQAVANPQADPNVPAIAPAIPIRRGGPVWIGGVSPTTVVRLQKGVKESK